MLYPKKEEHVKVQQREYVRVESPVDVAIHSVDNTFTPFTTVTEDISAGGAAVFVPQNLKFETDKMISAVFVLPVKTGGISYIKVNCLVVRLVEFENRTKNILAVKFVDIQDDERQMIIRFCFERQLELRDKGMKLY
ncbi:MAG: flagellar brake protein [Bacillus sp. (in: firmicutes)]